MQQQPRATFVQSGGMGSGGCHASECSEVVMQFEKMCRVSVKMTTASYVNISLFASAVKVR